MKNEIYAPKAPEYWKLRSSTHEGTVLNDALTTYNILSDVVFEYDTQIAVYSLTCRGRVVTVTGVPQDTAVKALVSRLIAPPDERHIFEREVHSVIMRDAGIQSLPQHAAGIASRIQRNSETKSFVRHYMDGGNQMTQFGNPAGANAVELLSSIAHEMEQTTDAVHTPSPLCSDPLLLARMMLYSYYDTPQGIYTDGIHGAIRTIVLLAGHIIHAAAQKGVYMIPNRSTVRQQYEALSSLIKESAFRRILYSFTATSNGVLFPGIRDLGIDPPFIEYVNGSYSITQILKTRMRDKMELTNRIGAQDKSSLGKVLIEGMTTAGCPVPHHRKAAVKPEDVLNVAWLPSNWQSMLRVPHEAIENPIDTIHTTVCAVLQELININS